MHFQQGSPLRGFRIGEFSGSFSIILRHGHRDPSIAALILDSPFANLEMVVRELIVPCP